MNLVVDEDGSSLVPFTTENGTWAVDGTTISIEGSCGVEGLVCSAWIDGLDPMIGPAACFQADFWIDPIRYTPMGFGFGGRAVYIRPDPGAPGAETTGLVGDYFWRDEPMCHERAWVIDGVYSTWLTLRLEFFAGLCHLYVNDVHIGRLRRSKDANWSLLYILPPFSNTVGSPSFIRNVKVWTADMDNP